jgi:simple sugar transport system permease protein
MTSIPSRPVRAGRGSSSRHRRASVRSLKRIVTDFGWPRIIIFIFLVLLFFMAPLVGVSVFSSFSDVFNRFGQNAIFVLALVPMIQSGCGLNFGLSLGIIAGLLGATLSIQFGLHGAAGFFGAIILASPFAVLFGGAYGKLLNKVKGEEMTIAMYVGFASVTFMCIMWLLLPYSAPDMVWGFAGKGLRTTISVENYWFHILNNFLAITGGDSVVSPSGVTSYEFMFPTGEILFVCLAAFLMWIFMRTKTGTAMTAVGSNPDYARAGGISVDKMRTVSVIISTLLAAVGIIVYEQSFGFVQLYLGPLYMPFAAIAAILIGGASVNKASMLNVLVGTFLFQGLLTMTPSVINSALKSDMSEVVRIVVSNGIIIYALTRKTKVTK